MLHPSLAKSARSGTAGLAPVRSAAPSPSAPRRSHGLLILATSAMSASDVLMALLRASAPWRDVPARVDVHPGLPARRESRRHARVGCRRLVGVDPGELGVRDLEHHAGDATRFLPVER